MPGFATREERAAYARSYYARPENAEKNKARGASKQAVRTGRLVRGPCEKCGEAKTEGHHDDYSKPLEIRWLCKKHHSEVHRVLPVRVRGGRPGAPKQTHCRLGHELTEDNLIRWRHKRKCRTCDIRRRVVTDAKRHHQERRGTK